MTCDRDIQYEDTSQARREAQEERSIERAQMKKEDGKTKTYYRWIDQNGGIKSFLMIYNFRGDRMTVIRFYDNQLPDLYEAVSDVADKIIENGKECHASEWNVAIDQYLAAITKHCESFKDNYSAIINPSTTNE